ncbi:hypothetical protein [Nonomuraea sp. WAC 01424]|nr:hypothetical protein [Nonomuraea sp. WAC 01424]
MYWVVVAIGLLAGIALVTWLPRTHDLHGGSITASCRPYAGSTSG